jgi:GNAT superfamily N-acetyltransferase
MEHFIIERLDHVDRDELERLIEASEAEGFRFVTRLAEEYISGANRFEQQDEALFGAYDGALVGVCGLNRDPYTGDTQIGCVRHLYVLPNYRRLGIGARLVDKVINEARRHYALLTLRTTTPAADAFYHVIGFEATIQVKDATHCMRLLDDP